MSARASDGPPPRRCAVVLATLGLTLLGCPEPPPEPCEGSGDPTLTLTNRGGGPQLVDGAEVEVFPPPQGGVFTELDVVIEDLALAQLEYLRIEIDAIDTGESLASVRYFGEHIPLRCTEDDVLELDYMPVGFVDGVVLEELDGVAARVTGVLETTRGDFSVEHDVVLRSVEY